MKANKHAEIGVDETDDSSDDGDRDKSNLRKRNSADPEDGSLESYMAFRGENHLR